MNQTSKNTPLEHRDIFLSHRSVNKEFARRLTADIESQKAGYRNLSVWFDEAEIRPGQSIPARINEGLEISKFVGLVMTPLYFESESGWTDAEWHSALYEDPDNRRERIIPLLVENCPYIPYLLRHFKMIDFRNSNYENALKELLMILREEPLPRPTTIRGQIITSTGKIDRQTLIAERGIIQADPDTIEEHLHCNLLPVLRLPEYIYIAPIKENLCRTRQDGTKALPSKQELKDMSVQMQTEAKFKNPFVPAFRTLEGKILTLHDLDDTDGPFASIIDDDNIEEKLTNEWIEDDNSRRVFVSLLNMAIARHAHHIGLVPDETKDKRFYFPPDNSKTNIKRWRPRRRFATRTVAKPCTDGDNKLLFWRHQAAYLKFIFLANKFYLQIIPTWVFTEDGKKVKGGPEVSKLAIKWCGAERNLQVLFHVRFWTLTLRNKNRGLINIYAGDQILELDTRPAFVQLPYGIVNDQKNLMQLLDEEATKIEEWENIISEEMLRSKQQYDEDIHDYNSEEVSEKNNMTKI